MLRVEFDFEDLNTKTKRVQNQILLETHTLYFIKSFDMFKVLLTVCYMHKKVFSAVQTFTMAIFEL